MSEFKEMLNTMKETVNSELSIPEIDIVEDSPQEETQETPSVQQNEKGHRKRKVGDRIKTLTAEKRMLESEKQRLQAYVQNQEVALSELRARTEQQTHYSNVYYEHGLETEQQRLRTELKIAKDEGDTEKEVDLQQRMSEVAAQKQTQLLSKTLQQPQPANYQQPYYPEQSFAPPQPAYEEPTNEALEDWLEDNSWADPNSPYFDSTLSQQANEIAFTMNKKLSYNKHAHLIGTPEYYQAITEEMDKSFKIDSGNNAVNYDEYEYNDEYQPPAPQYRQPSSDRSYAVAPVTKRGSSMAERYIPTNNSPQRMSLTPAERDIAVKLAPELTKIHGRHINEQEACVMYYKEKMKLPPEERLQPGMQMWERY